MTGLQEGSYLLIFLALVGSGSGLPISEDAVILGAGALTDHGVFEVSFALVACVAGVLLGDLVVFSVARRLGPAVFERKFVQRIVSRERRERVHAAIEQRGGVAVFFFRFLIGFRFPAFATAGAFGLSPWKFVVGDALGACLSVPAVFFMGYTFSSRLDEIEDAFASGSTIVLVVVGAIFSVFAIIIYRSHRRGVVHDLEHLPMPDEIDEESPSDRRF